MLKINKFLKDTILYVIADILNKIAIFLLIPIYTSVFTVKEYGVLEQIVIISTVLNIIISFASKTSFLRLYFKYSEKDIKIFLSTLILFISSIFFIILTIFFIINQIFILGKYEIYIYYILIYIFFLVINQLVLVLLRVQKKILYYSIFNLLKTILEISLIIFFVKYLNFGIIGKLQASLISIIILFLVIFKLYLFKNIEFKININFLLDYIKYSRFIVIHQFFGWFLISYDKLLINKSFSTLELGIYALGLQSLAIFKYISESALKAFNVEIFSNTKIINKYFDVILLFILSGIIFFSLFFSLFSKEIILILANEKYFEAEIIIRYFIFSRVIMIYNFILVMILYLYEDTKSVLYSTYIGVISSLIISTLLIPKFHFLGAAISATIVYAIIAYFLTKKVFCYVKFNFNKYFLFIGLLLLLSIYIAQFEINVTLKIIIIFIYLFILLILNKDFILKFYYKKEFK